MAYMCIKNTRKECDGGCACCGIWEDEYSDNEATQECFLEAERDMDEKMLRESF